MSGPVLSEFCRSESSPVEGYHGVELESGVYLLLAAKNLRI